MINLTLSIIVFLIAGYIIQLLTVIMFIIGVSFINNYAYISPISVLSQENYYSIFWMFIGLEFMLFISYFWYYYHHYSYSIIPITTIFLSNNLYYIGGIMLSLLSIVLDISLLIVFMILTYLEYSGCLAIVSMNDSNLILINLTIVVLHLLHILVGLLFMVIEVSYGYYYHFIEIIWILIGFIIYL